MFLRQCVYVNVNVIYPIKGKIGKGAPLLLLLLTGFPSFKPLVAGLLHPFLPIKRVYISCSDDNVILGGLEQLMSTVSLTFNLGVWRWGRSSPSQALMDLPRCGFGPFAFYGARFRLYTHLLRILSHFLSTPLSKLGLISLKHCVKHTFCLTPPIESIILCFFQVR